MFGYRVVKTCFLMAIGGWSSGAWATNVSLQHQGSLLVPLYDRLDDSLRLTDIPLNAAYLDVASCTGMKIVSQEIEIKPCIMSDLSKDISIDAYSYDENRQKVMKGKWLITRQSIQGGNIYVGASIELNQWPTTKVAVGIGGGWVKGETDGSGRLSLDGTYQFLLKTWLEQGVLPIVIVWYDPKTKFETQVNVYKQQVPVANDFLFCNQDTGCEVQIPNWCQVSIPENKIWTENTKNPYLICVDMTQGSAMVMVEGGVPIIEPNQPLFVVVRHAPNKMVGVKVEGKVGFQAPSTADSGESGSSGGSSGGISLHGAFSTGAVVSVWPFAPRTSEEPVTVEISNSSAQTDPKVTFDLLVRHTYTSAIRTGIAMVWLPDQTVYDVGPAYPGTGTPVVRSYEEHWIPEIVVGYTFILPFQSRDNVYPRVVKRKATDAFSPYIAIGVLGPATSVNASAVLPVSALTSLHGGVEVELMPGTSIAITGVMRRSWALRENWTVGSPYTEAADSIVTTSDPSNSTINTLEFLRPTLTPGVALVINISPQFFRFSTQFPRSIANSNPTP